MKVLEFLGLPGSGKSTLARAVQKIAGAGVVNAARDGEYLALRQDMTALQRALSPGWMPDGLRNRTARFLCAWRDDIAAYDRFLEQSPDYERAMLAASTWQAENAVGTDSWMVRAKRAFDLAVVVQRLRDANRHATLILDPGFCMRVTSAYGFGPVPPPRAAVAGYLAAMPRPDVALFMDATPELCRQRIAGRPRGWPERLSTASEARRTQVLANMHEVLHVAAPILTELGVPVIRFDAAAPLPSHREIAGRVALALRGASA